MFKSSQLCQTLFGGNSTTIPEEATKRKLPVKYDSSDESNSTLDVKRQCLED